jgi:cytochrome c oxidase subunit II
MEGRLHDRDEQVGQKRRGGFTARLLTLGMLAISALLVLAACGPDVDKPYSTTTPASTTADDIHGLYKLVFWLSLIVFVGVQFAIVYVSMRYRRKNSDTRRPPQIHGNKRLEIIWTIIPAVVLLVLLVPTVTLIFDHDAQAQNGELQIDAYGKQWWWEFHYNEDNAQGGDSLDVVTANEIVIPVGKNTVFNLQSNNVIHSFWVPQLAGKMDLIPGHVNRLSLTPTQTGEFYGECAEFCGAQHAWMRFKITVVTEDEFYAWVNNWRSAPAQSVRADAGEGVIQAPQTFQVCLACHTVNGMEGSNALQGINAPQNMGPDLTMLACRESLAAGMLVNTPENLAQWIRDPGAVKPGNYMATQIGPGAVEFDDDQVNELVDYLFALQPEGGCTAPDGWSGGDGEPATGTDPAATPESGS